MSWLISSVFKDTLERVTGMLPAINSDHAYIHYGIGYKAHIEVASLAGTNEYSFKTPSDRYVHFKNVCLTGLGGSAKFSLKRGTEANLLTIDSAGTTPVSGLTGPHNMNDSKGPEARTEIKAAPTYTGSEEGEVWDIVSIVGDATNQYTSVSETQRSDTEEFVMKPDTYYVLRLEKVGTDTPTQVILSLFFYEEGDG